MTGVMDRVVWICNYLFDLGDKISVEKYSPVNRPPPNKRFKSCICCPLQV